MPGDGSKQAFYCPKHGYLGDVVKVQGPPGSPVFLPAEGAPILNLICNFKGEIKQTPFCMMCLQKAWSKLCPPAVIKPAGINPGSPG